MLDSAARPCGGRRAETRRDLGVSLRPNGALTGEPTLLAASASPKGGALLQTAMRALRQCQSFGFLPEAKYKEWNDLSFSPAGLSSMPTI
jgi:hypothetical protein